MTHKKPAPRAVHDPMLRVFMFLLGALQLLALGLASTAARRNLLLHPPYRLFALVALSLSYPLLVVKLRRSTGSFSHAVAVLLTCLMLFGHIVHAGLSAMPLLSACMAFLLVPALLLMLLSSRILRSSIEISGVFEIHVTVRNDPVRPEEQEREFADTCKALGVKFVRICLPQGEHMLQLMTSSYVVGTAEAAIRAARELAIALQDEHGFDPIRVKVEALISNEGVAQFAAQDMSEDNYFEFHLKTVIRPDQEVRVLENLCKEHDAHFSRNAFARKPDGTEHRFLTIRKHISSKMEAEECCDRCIDSVQRAGFEVVSTEREFAVFDTNLSLDKGWLVH